MTTALQIVERLQHVLATTAREGELLESIEKSLGELRSIYRDRPEDFDAQTIEYLKRVRSISNALFEFKNALEDMGVIRTRDDAEELTGRLQDLKERLLPHLVSKRVEKEVRELLSRLNALPSAAEAIRDAGRRLRVVLLEQKAHKCHKCNGKMVLRESDWGLFWGCSSFPKCFGRRWLTKSESQFLADDRSRRAMKV